MHRSMVSAGRFSWGWLMISDHHTTQSPGDELRILSIATLVVWMTCLVAGVVGIVLKYPPIPLAAELPTPVDAKFINVRVTKDPFPPPDAGAVPHSEQPAMQLPPNAPAVSALPPLAPVFPMPSKEPPRVANVQPAVAATPAIVELTFGQGEGEQPAPEYPPECRLARQEGKVTVLFTVGEDGQVTGASAISPCPYALLNQAAVRAIRDTWRFKTGPRRSFKVSIQFELTER
jgi:TonB family protein